LAAAIKDAIGIDAELIAGDGGVFEVEADGRMVFSKKESGYFPKAPEVLELIGAVSG